MTKPTSITFKLRSDHLGKFKSEILVSLALIVVVPMLLAASGETENLATTMIVLAGLISIFWSLHVCLHFRYWALNKGCTIKFFPTDYKFEFRSPNSPIVRFYKKDIAKVEKVMTSARHNAGYERGWYPWDYYYFVRIVLLDGTELIVTDFLVRESDWPIKLVYEKVKKVIPWPSGHKFGADQG